MKHNNHHCRTMYQPAYPNAADSVYFAEKALEILAALASGLCVSTVMLFLLVLA